MSCELWLDGFVLDQRTTFQSLQASSLLSFVAMEPHCLWHAVPWSLDTCSTHLPTECRCSAPEIETPICARRTTIHQFVWQQRMCGADYQWKVEWADNPTDFIPDTGTHPLKITLPKTARVQLNRLRTGAARFRSSLCRWGMASSAACEYGAEKQTVDHVVIQYAIHQPPHGLHGLSVLDDETIEWLFSTWPGI